MSLYFYHHSQVSPYLEQEPASWVGVWVGGSYRPIREPEAPVVLEMRVGSVRWGWLAAQIRQAAQPWRAGWTEEEEEAPVSDQSWGS